MSMSRPNTAPRVPTPPRGEEIASYATYLEAQKAVDYLSDNRFAVEAVTIVGADLKMVERVTGRLTYGRVALAGAASGAWFGLFVGLLLYMFGSNGAFMLTAIAVGAGFGLLFSVLSYALTRGRRDFTSQSQIVAASYGILCAREQAGEARRMLAQMPDGAGAVRGPSGGAGAPANPGWGTPPGGAGGSGASGPATPAGPGPAAPAPQAPQPTRAPDPRWTTPSGEPRYGAMRPTPEQDQPAPEQAPPTPPRRDEPATDESGNRPTPPA